MYDIEKLWVTEEALQGMHLTTDALVEGVTLLAEQQVPGLLQQHSNILNF
jgi:tRNA 2-thiouridine synthesizing protein C